MRKGKSPCFVLARLSCLLAVWVCTTASTATPLTPPHIIMAITDDLGWHYPGYHNPTVHTPTLDRLATQEGVRLNHSYMYKYCSPSRGSFMTGRYPWKMASTRCNFIPSSIPEGIDLGYTFLPKHLARANYYSTHIGKWHLGFHTTDYTPVARGFNESFGFLEGGEDHWTHKCGAGQTQCHTPGQPRQSKTNWDLWEQSTDNFPGGPLYGTNGTTGDTATYSGYIFTKKAVTTIQNHRALRGDNVPLFMYLALHNTHAPIEAPQRFIDLYNTGDVKHDTFNAMVSVVDESIQNITEALKTSGMWNNTLLVWTTDNGSPVQVGGSNHPLRGGKSTNWQGGVRVPTFVTGGVVPPHMHGQTLNGLVHVSDWFATFSDVARLGPNAPAQGPAVPDSLSMWPYLSGTTTVSPRTVLVHDHRMYTNASRNHDGDLCNGQRIFEKEGYDSLGAVRSGDYKLIVGNEWEASWFGAFSPNTTGVKPDLNAVACVEAPCLFDVVSDPGEHVDLAPTHPDVVQRLWGLFNQSNAAHHPRVLSPRRDVKGFCGAVLKHGGWVAPWLQPGKGAVGKGGGQGEQR